MKKVLIIAYYFPPMGGSGVQRPLKFVKYLRDFGWEPIVICPEPGAYPWFDESLQKELDGLSVTVHRVTGNTPLHTGGKQRQLRLPSFIEETLRKISAFFWLPDNKRGWIKSALPEALELIRKHSIDAVFATAMPFSNLLLAARIKEEIQIPVVMDLRDEWMQSHLLNFPTPVHRKIMASYEKKALSRADVITVINEAYRASISSRYPDQPVQLLRQGYDPMDFEESKDIVNSSGKLRLLHSGLFYGARQPVFFLEAVTELITEQKLDRELMELRFQGKLGSRLKKKIHKLGLEDLVTDLGYQSHDNAVRELQQADVLWLMIGHLKHADKVTLGKMFEYFGTNKPILALIPEGESRRLLRKYGAAYFAYPFSKEEIKKALLAVISDYKSSKLPAGDQEFTKSFNRKSIAGDLAALLTRVTEG